YWLLTEAQPGHILDKYNRRLAYALRVADTGTWNSNRLLRLPVGVNLKYDPPTPVRLHFIDPSRLYTLDDFERLPDVEEVDGSEVALPPRPEPQDERY